MAKVTRSNPNALTVLTDRIDTLDTKEGRAGWFESSVYPDGTPVAYIASVQEFGARITRFGSKAGDYQTIIPPRPFMRPTIERERNNWLRLMMSGAKAILAGNETASTVMNKVVLKAAADIAKTISQITTPPLKPATIAARRNRLTDTKTTGALTKPLVDTGLLFDSVTGIVDDA